jgi:hypothetical protein
LLLCKEPLPFIEDEAHCRVQEWATAMRRRSRLGVVAVAGPAFRAARWDDHLGCLAPAITHCNAKTTAESECFALHECAEEWQLLILVLAFERIHSDLNQLVGTTRTVFPYRFEFFVVELVVVHKRGIDVLQRLRTQLIYAFYAFMRSGMAGLGRSAKSARACSVR